MSTASARHASRIEPSHVLTARGTREAWLHGSVFSLGYGNAAEDIDQAAAAVARAVRRLRSMLSGRVSGTAHVRGLST